MGVQLIPFFDDAGSVGHAAIEFILAKFPLSLAALGFSIFAAYQLAEDEPMPNKIGDFGELATGFLIAKTI